VSAHTADILLYAFRYALGRSSYAPGDVMDALAADSWELDDGTRRVIVLEIRAALEAEAALPYAEDWRRTMDLLDSGAAE
jgi:hypothetical protein